MNIIMSFFTEEVASMLTEEELYRLSLFCQKPALAEVEKYLSSIDGCDKVVKSKVSKAFAKQLFINDFYSDEVVKSRIKNIAKNLSVYDIRFESDPKMLSELDDLLSVILDNDSVQPYESKVSSSQFNEFLKDLKKEHSTEKVDNDSPYSIMRFIQRISASAVKKLFQSKANSRAVGTSAKLILKDRQYYDNFRRGVRFIMSKQESCANPKTWRVL